MAQQSSKEYTCFFITPIGKENSPERKNSDFVLKHLIIPALRQCGFQRDYIIRSDQEANPGKITDRMEQHIQHDDLCVVDLTGLNANVMYEYGMRKGIGKPSVVIAKKDTDMPFDVYDENTIFYDPTSFEEFYSAQEKLENAVRYWMDQGFVNSAGEGSVSDITKRLRAIEDKLDSVLSTRVKVGPGPTPRGNNKANELVRSLGPIGAFNYALQQRDVALGEDLMPRLEQAVDKNTYIDSVVSQLAILGSERAGKILKAEWPYISTNFSFKMQNEAFGCYVGYCNRRNCEPDNLEFILNEAERLLDRADDNKEKASIYNQLSRFYHGAYRTLKKQNIIRKEYLNEAIQALTKATEFCPDEASYYFNLAVCFMEQEEEEKAFDAINKCMDLDSDDDDHLVLAYKIYQARQSPRADVVYEKLVRINPFRAEMLR